ncbi:CWF19-like protein 2 [Marmota monax]|uniref:CWF19-like protein 2 n=1 Tax=Marmota monax TaxID=9995 RepID=UPI001EB0537C|nr:CWF19-like protein 2 [Marmota monax]KAI6053626.1 CWF19L2 [Marmota monax]KAI6065554.1 CWF19L2 [Marmota monax]
MTTTMAASSGRFESAKSIEERKEQIRTARAEILRQAKANFEKEERHKEIKRLRGDDTWMLPDVNERIEQFSQEHSVKKKKKKDKHSKKAKKEKKKKSKRQKYEKNNESSDSSSSSEDEWVEAVPFQTSGKEKAWKVKDENSGKDEDSQVIQRDEWMTVDFMSVKTVSSSSLKAEKETIKKIEQAKTQALEQSKLLERELNPYWKDGGTGLPSEDCSVSSVTKASGVEDGGLSWLKKSYQRMKEQAEKQNKKFEDIVAERYGSMELFQSKLEEAEKTASKKEDSRRERWRKPTYSDKAQNSQENKKLDLIKYNKSSRDRYGTTEITNNNNKDKFSGDEKDERSGSLETCRREYNPRQNQELSSGNLRPKFLRPTDDEELSCHSKGRNFEPSSSSLALVTQGALHCGFQKPTENSEESLTSWSSSYGRKEEKKYSNQKALETSSSIDYQHISGDTREKLQTESLSDDPPTRKNLQDAKATYTGPKDESIHILSMDEKNKLGARIIKAEMMGNLELAEQLKAQLEKANKFKETETQISLKKSGVENEEQEVILVRTDDSGRVWPVNTPGESLDSKAGRRKRQKVFTHEEKERVRYFPDDDHLSLNDLVKNEKMGTVENQNKLFMRMASKFMGKTDGDYYTLDDMFVSKAAERQHLGEEEENQRKRAIAEHQSLAAQMEKCLYCFDSSQFPKHLIVAIGIKVYLCLPNFQSLTEGHCLIVPLQHHRAATLLDEDIWEEIQMFRKSLVKMFECKELDCIFLETNMSMKKQYHMVYECIPLPKEVGDMAPIYFKKAIMESDEEWSMNKKLIDLSSKDIRKSVPRGLPYFSVDFGLQGGFAHVIEDQHKFPHYFGKEIIGGMLDLDPRLWRKGIRESFEDQRKKALQFAQWWKPYDFTKSKTC